MTLDTIQRGANMRRSQYHLNDQLPISREDMQNLVLDIIRTTPSGFDSQTARPVLLWGDEHKKMWDTVQEVLQPMTDPEQYPKTVEKMDGFRKAAGTLLFFEEGAILRKLEQDFPKFANNVPLFSAHTNAMHQYAAWTQLAALGIGANLQHYNPVADDAIKRAFNLPDSWELHAQMVFGGITAPTEKVKTQKLPPQERLLVRG